MSPFFRPREGCGLHHIIAAQSALPRRSCCPREGHGLHRKGDQPMINTILGCCPREGYGLHPSGTSGNAAASVAVPVRGAGCIVKLKVTDRPKPERFFVPVRGTGCITRPLTRSQSTWGCCPREGHGLHHDITLSRICRNLVAVPVRGAGCIRPQLGVYDFQATGLLSP